MKKIQKINDMRKQYCQSEKLPFGDILDERAFREIIDEASEGQRDRIFTPAVTLAAFIHQTMNPDQSCNQAVSAIIAERVLNGQQANSANTGPYCKARKRLSEEMIRQLSTEAGKKLNEQANESWKWRGRHVKLVDGTTISGPDTPANQSEYPQPDTQEEGLGFPIARCVAVISLSVGAVLGFALGAYEGKETGEHALLREILECYSSGDVMLGDRYYCSYFLIAMLQQKNVDAVFQMHASRQYDFRRGTSLGKKDHIVEWNKPDRPSWMDKEMYARMPSKLTVRETEIGKKVIVSTFLDHDSVTKKDIGDLYKCRWTVEVDLRSIKETMQMGILRCKTPEMMRKEIFIHILAYNLIRTVMAQAAEIYNKKPRKISFKGTLQKINSFRVGLCYVNEEDVHSIHEHMLWAIASGKVGDRPGRSEPRVVKRRPKPYPRMTQPRRKIS